MYRLKGCCCCCSLRTGSLVLAILGLLSGFSSLTSYSRGLGVDEDELAQQLRHQDDQLREMLDQGQVSRQYYDLLHGYIQMVLHYLPYLPYVCAAGLAMGALFFLFYGLLFAGIVYRKTRLMLPWFFFKILLFILSLALHVVVGIYLGQAFSVMASLCYALFLLPVVGLSFYFIWVVYSYYLELLDEKAQGIIRDHSPILVEELPPAYDQVADNQGSKY